ncbi:MAG: DOPA 4,5-dioxygenase family protein [Microcoleus sp.]
MLVPWLWSGKADREALPPVSNSFFDGVSANTTGSIGQFATSQVSLKLTTPLKMMKEDTIEIVGFHAHIYFDTDSRDAAARVRAGLTRFEVQLGRWHDKPIGPHPQPMYQVVFLPEQFGKVVSWLMLNREGLDILVHPETGDDVADHTKYSLWLGQKLELNFEFLRP